MTSYGLPLRTFQTPLLAVSNMLELRNGFAIPQLGFGTYRMNPTDVDAAVTYALECGYRHIDCAKAYSNQKDVGQTLSKCFKKGTARREEVFVTSKLWPTDQHPDHVESACRATLAELKLDYLDLFLIHWPVCWRHSKNFSTDEDKYPKDANGFAAVDDSVTLLDTWRAMSALVDKGLVRSIGLSNCKKSHIQEVLSDGTLHLPVINQIEVHPGLTNSELSAFQRGQGILTAAYCPLGMPTRLTPPAYRPLTETEILQKLSEYTGYSPERILLNWSIDENNVVIVKSTKKEHIKSNAKAARFQLEDSVRFALNGYEKAVLKFRVMNPPDFTKDGRPFFSDDE